MRTSTRVSGTDAMADHVETLASRSNQADVPRQATAGAPLLHAIWRFCRRKPLGALGGAIVLVMIVMAVFAPYIAHYTYDETIRGARMKPPRSEEHTSELQSRLHLVCRLLLEKKKKQKTKT